MNKLDQKAAMKIGYGVNEIASTTHCGDDKNDDNNSKVYVRWTILELSERMPFRIFIIISGRRNNFSKQPKYNQKNAR